MPPSEWAAARLSEPDVKEQFLGCNDGQLPDPRFLVDYKPPYVVVNAPFSYAGCHICQPVRENWGLFHSHCCKNVTRIVTQCENKAPNQV